MQQLHPHQLSLPVSSQTQCLPPPEVVPAQSVYVVVEVVVVLQFRQHVIHHNKLTVATVHGKSRQMTQKKFRLQLAYSLTEAEISKRANPPNDAVLRGPGRPPTPMPRLLGKHFAYNSHIRHRMCAKQKNPVTGKYKDTKTVTRCDKCGVHLCIRDCFELWHTNDNV